MQGLTVTREFAAVHARVDSVNGSHALCQSLSCPSCSLLGANVQLQIWDCFSSCSGVDFKEGGQQVWFGGGDLQFKSPLGIVNFLPTDKCIDLWGGNATNGARLGIWDCQ
jgi:hypothetical protein